MSVLSITEVNQWTWVRYPSLLGCTWKNWLPKCNKLLTGAVFISLPPSCSKSDREGVRVFQVPVLNESKMCKQDLPVSLNWEGIGKGLLIMGLPGQWAMGKHWAHRRQGYRSQHYHVHVPRKWTKAFHRIL